MNGDEWNGLSKLLSNLIAKYADVLDIDSLPDPKSDSKDTKTNEIDISKSRYARSYWTTP